MQVALLYATIVLIWGSTWFAITFQLGPVAEEISVVYRFGLASIALFAFAALSGRRVRIPLNRYGHVVLMGILLYSVNYMLVYHGTSYLTSGLVAVIFSLIILFNAFFERLIFKRPFEVRMMVASILGLGGIVCLFWPEVSEFNLGDRTIFGALLVITSVVIASLGNMVAIVNTAKDLPVTAVNAHGMAWGALSSLIIAVFMGHRLEFSTDPAYLTSLLYLAVAGSAIAFGAYLALLRIIGSARAAYTSVLFPIVALLISTVFEGYRWTLPAFIGVLLIVVGNWLALTRINGE
ncbi:MAG: DMT family transporter [Woeseiaceae bacterium]|nr:DMT family transporter [Woeseiaceae bacterium]